jgi:hypothetical protein
MSWYDRTSRTTTEAFRLKDIKIPARIEGIETAIASGTLGQAVGRRKIRAERGWSTRMTRLIDRRVAQGKALPTKPA